MEDYIEILIVDPDETNAQVLSAVLNNGQYRVTFAQNEQEVKACIQNQEFVIVIIDLKIPEQQLFEMIGLLKKDQPTLSIVLTSDHTNPETMIQAIRYQVGDFLLRPFEDEFLLERLGDIIQKQQVSKQKEECMKRLQELMDKLEDMEKTTNHNETLSPKPDNQEDHILQVGNLLLDLETRQVFADGFCEFHLTTTNFNYLKVLAMHAPRAVSFTNLVKEAQGYTLSKKEAKSLAFWHIYKLRKELSAGLERDVIQNVRGYGYKLNVM